MVSEDLDRIERELGIRLPADYRALVLTYPVGLGTSGPSHELLDDPERLIAVNREYRERGFFGIPWPAHFFCFGGDGSGNRYYLDLRKEPSPVYVADHAGSLVSEQWPALDAWLAERRREETDRQQEQRQRAARKANRRGWKFWI